MPSWESCSFTLSIVGASGQSIPRSTSPQRDQRTIYSQTGGSHTTPLHSRYLDSSRSLHDRSFLTLATHPEYTADRLQALGCKDVVEPKVASPGPCAATSRCTSDVEPPAWIEVITSAFTDAPLAAEATFKLVAPTVQHVADDVVRSAILLPVVPERLTLDDSRVDFLLCPESVDVAEPSRPRPPQRAVQLALLVRTTCCPRARSGRDRLRSWQRRSGEGTVRSRNEQPSTRRTRRSARRAMGAGRRSSQVASVNVGWQLVRPLSATTASTDGCGPPQPKFPVPGDKTGTIRKRNEADQLPDARRSGRPSFFQLTSSPLLHFLVRHVQVALRLLNARVAEHQLDDADVDAVRQQAARAFVPQVVPAEIDPFEEVKLAA